jgi:phosphatidylserine decarboxylase
LTIHKEGRTLLFILLVILTLVNAGIYYGLDGNGLIFKISVLVSIVLFIMVLQFFRNPLRRTVYNEKHVIAPADGKVVVIEKTREDEYFHDERIQISIFMSPVNVHVNRMPVKGVVEYFKYHAGKYLVAWHPKSSIENERTTMVIKTEDSIPVLVRQIAGAVARRIKWYVREGSSLEQGQEFGFIKFGSRVDVFLPVDSEVKVKIGEKTRGGMTILADLA